MKMKWFDRILLALVMLCMLAVSVALIGIALGVLNQPVEQLYSVMTNGLWVNSLILIVIGAVLILMVIRVLYASCARNRVARGYGANSKRRVRVCADTYRRARAGRADPDRRGRLRPERQSGVRRACIEKA